MLLERDSGSPSRYDARDFRNCTHEQALLPIRRSKIATPTAKFRSRMHPNLPTTPESSKEHFRIGPELAVPANCSSVRVFRRGASAGAAPGTLIEGQLFQSTTGSKGSIPGIPERQLCWRPS